MSQQGQSSEPIIPVAGILLAAGAATRCQQGLEKPFIQIHGRPLFSYSLLTILTLPGLCEVVMVVPAHRLDLCRTLVQQLLTPTIPLAIISGGATRQESSLLATTQLSTNPALVVIHDAARPNAHRNLFTSCLHAAALSGAALTAVQITDTIKLVSSALSVERTIPRTRLWAAQTPQIFSYSLLKAAHQHAALKGFYAPDDASMVEFLGCPVTVVPGSSSNIKVTSFEDLDLMTNLVQPIREKQP